MSKYGAVLGRGIDGVCVLECHVGVLSTRLLGRRKRLAARGKNTGRFTEIMAALGNFGRTVRLMLGQVHRRRAAAKPSETFDGPSKKSVSCMSQSAAAAEEAQRDENCEEISKEFLNRNPRNLEQMALARKDRGWETVWPSNHYYHRLVYSRSQHYITAEIFAPHSSTPILSCSTKEWALKRELHSTRSVVASQAVGEVLAVRCREAGLLRLTFRVVPWTFRSESVKKFRMALKGGGIKLCEPRRKYVD